MIEDMELDPGEQAEELRLLLARYQRWHDRLEELADRGDLSSNLAWLVHLGPLSDPDDWPVVP